MDPEKPFNGLQFTWDHLARNSYYDVTKNEKRIEAARRRQAKKTKTQEFDESTDYKNAFSRKIRH